MEEKNPQGVGRQKAPLRQKGHISEDRKWSPHSLICQRMVLSPRLRSLEGQRSKQRRCRDAYVG